MFRFSYKLLIILHTLFVSPNLVLFKFAPLIKLSDQFTFIFHRRPSYYICVSVLQSHKQQLAFQTEITATNQELTGQKHKYNSWDDGGK